MDKYVVYKGQSIIEVMKAIDHNSQKIVFLCDEGKHLIGTITDGDIRRYMIKNGNLEENAEKVVNRSPIFLYKYQSENYGKYMTNAGITALPIVNQDMVLVDIKFLFDTKKQEKEQLHIPVVIMAGGKGTRLEPYTRILPKPLIPIGEKTIIETIMDNFEAYGCDSFDLIINYKKNLIKAFFLDCDKTRKVTFYEEKEFLGTAGGLRLLKGRIKQTFFMSNCDILIDWDYSKFLREHEEKHNLITMVCVAKRTEIPYGIVETSEDGSVCHLKEKPQYTFMTNTGLYVIEPEFLDQIPENTFIHITDVIQNCIDEGKKVGAYLINEDAWQDMGQIEDLYRMKEYYSE